MTARRDYRPRDGRSPEIEDDLSGPAIVSPQPGSARWTDAFTGTRAARLWHGLVAVMAFAGIGMELWTAIADTVASGPAAVAARLAYLFCYFTILSNTLLAVTSVLLVLDPRRDGPIFRVARLDAVLCIAVTGIVYNTVLSGLRDLTEAGIVSNFLLHQGGPLLAVVGWFVVGPRPRADRRTVVWSMAAPLAWIAYTFAAGAISGFYPYPFMQADVIGYPAALLGTGIVVVIFLVLASILGRLDTRLGPVPTA
ncbi:Pr6Pr family membrane protein [Rathayibacter sp. YIM 133350]|uniref:Pr6Pr family membrane protein n=1 Tax=Rathayibacter sp. YIM 133350 TaxID=3131992 RepID=UPI00307F7786